MRVVQMTPLGSACSVVLAEGVGPEGAPGSRVAFFGDLDGNEWAVQEYRRA
jgi:hypothetical protein